MQPAIHQNVILLTKQPTPPVWWILLCIENKEYKAKGTETDKIKQTRNYS